MILIAPSILSANFANLQEDIGQAEKAGADWLHIDVMDGKFVPNLTIGPPVVADLRKVSNLFFDIHLMIEKPELLIPDFVKAGADMITVHAETCPHLHRTLQMIKEAGVKAGVALNPSTPPVMIENVLRDLDLVLVMTVNPGFGGQAFIPAMLPKIQALQHMIQACAKPIYLQVDGGINAGTGRDVVEAGCNVLVAGSYVFSSGGVAEAIRNLKALGALDHREL